LPSEAEWEYAARAGTATVWWTGGNKESLEGAANLCDLSFYNCFGHVSSYSAWNDGFPAAAPVGSFLPNAFGLYDVCGNVAEWCHDCCAKYGSQPPDVSSFESRFRVCRGGNWTTVAPACRSSVRYIFDPENSHATIGLRPACSLETQSGLEDARER
jgi:formylglycine-generating enzyme required for sulfatase activity